MAVVHVAGCYATTTNSTITASYGFPSPVHIGLWWKSSANAPKQLVGYFALHLPELLAANLIRFEHEHEPGDEVRVRFYRGSGGVVYIQSRRDRPSLPIATVILSSWTGRASSNVPKPLRGSRKHILDWVSSPTFRTELNALLLPAPVHVPEGATWMPRSHAKATEARLGTFGPKHLPHAIKWQDVRTWWLLYPKGANTPNWDFVSTCEIKGQSGLLLLEAKANHRELSKAPKPLSAKASARSRANHNHITKAIQDAAAALAGLAPGIAISVATHYQLSNRIAFAWKLASLGLPTVLTFVGFTRDSGIADVSAPFADDVEWRKAFHDYANAVFPLTACETRIDTNKAPFWVLVRSKDRMSPSASRAVYTPAHNP